MSGLCPTFWGSHGCDLPEGHGGNHLCGVGDPDGLCSEHDGQRVRYLVSDDTWSAWAPSETYIMWGWTTETEDRPRGLLARLRARRTR